MRNLTTCLWCVLGLTVTLAVGAGFSDGPTPLDRKATPTDPGQEPWKTYLAVAVWVALDEQGRLAIHDCSSAGEALAGDAARLAPMHGRLTAGLPLAWERMKDAGLDVALRDDPETLSRVLRGLMVYDLEHSTTHAETLARIMEAGDIGPVVVDVDSDATCTTGRCDCGPCPRETWEFCGCLDFRWISPTQWQCVQPRADCTILVPVP